MQPLPTNVRVPVNKVIISMYIQMNQLIMLFLVIQFMFFSVKAQSPSGNFYIPSSSNDVVNNFRPNLVVVVSIITTMLFCTFLLLLYAKYCQRGSSVYNNTNNVHIHDTLPPSSSRFSGINKNVIESLPFFRFSALKGSREGLECVVCLSKFEDIEILRLLPKCRHAFHIVCIDQWLEKHSSCPLCRHKVNSDDLDLLKDSNSWRFLTNPSDPNEESNFELFVEREEEDQHGSSRFSFGGSFRKYETLPPIQQSNDLDENNKVLHKLNHTIVISDVVLKNRWSNLSSSDLLYLNSEMISDVSSNRFSSLDSNLEQLSRIEANKEGAKMNFHSESSASSSKIANHAEKRSMSEIIVHSRFREFNMKNNDKELSVPGINIREERKRRLWLRIARRTVQLFANRDQRSSLANENTRQSSNV